MTFPETRVDLNRLIKKMKPELGSESFQNCKNTFSACTDGRPNGGGTAVLTGVDRRLNGGGTAVLLVGDHRPDGGDRRPDGGTAVLTFFSKKT